MSTGVSIVGAGLSKFGRQPEPHRPRARRSQAIEAALRDAGLEWTDVQVAFGGSDGSGLADTLVADLGLTGIPFTNVKNGCATGGSALMSAVHAIRSGAAEVALAVGFDKHPRGAFDPRPEDWGLPAAYGEAGPDGDHPVLRHQDRPLPARARHQRADPGPGGREGLPQRRAQPQRLAPRADPGRRDRRRGHGQRPADPAACSARPARAAPRSSSPATPWPPASGRAGAACSVRPPAPGASAPSRSSAPRSRAPAAPSSVSADAAAAAFAAAGVGPDEVDVAQLQDTESGAEVMHLAECGFCKDGEQEAMVAGGRDRDRRPAAGQHRRRLHRQRRADRRLRACARSTRSSPSCAARPATARSPARGSASPMSTAHRASAPARCWRSEAMTMTPHPSRPRRLRRRRPAVARRRSPSRAPARRVGRRPGLGRRLRELDGRAGARRDRPDPRLRAGEVRRRLGCAHLARGVRRPRPADVVRAGLPAGGGRLRRARAAPRCSRSPSSSSRPPSRSGGPPSSGSATCAPCCAPT